MTDTVVYRRELASLGHWDVAVLGGGPAGVCAAVEAARSGARVVLIEGTGMLGGMATGALVGPLMTSYDREGDRPVVGGLYREIVERLHRQAGAILPEDTDSPSIHTSFIDRYHRHVTPIDSFLLQIVLDDMVREAGVELMLYTRFADCICEDGVIKSAVLAALEGPVALSADQFIDCTGNADVAYAAGVPTWKGDEESGVPQPGTLMFEVDQVDDEAYNAYAARPEYPVKVYRTPQEGVYKVNHYHVYDVDAADSRSMTRGHVEARRQVLDAYRVLRDKTPGFERASISRTPSVLGIRESRHIRGQYMLTVEDVNRGVRFEDRIAAYAFGMDVHTRSDSAPRVNFTVEVAPVYYIPYRCMLPVGCANLLVAGKTVSSQSQAAGSLRVMPCAMALGQAAGAAAAIACREGVTPAEVCVDRLQQHLLERGAILD